MKRLFAIVLAAAMALSSFSALAADAGLEAAIKLVKTTFDVPEECTEFSFDTQSRSGESTYYLEWNVPDDWDGYSYAGATVTNGYVVSYYSHTPEESDAGRIPKVSRADALEAAAAQAKRALGEYADKFDYDNGDVNYRYNSYNIRFSHLENGIRVDGGDANVTVNGLSGRVTSYDVDINKDVSYPDPSGAMDEDAAAAALTENGAIKLVYRPFYKEKTIDVRLVYVLDAYVAIDAFTGAKVENNYFHTYATSRNMAAEEAEMDGAGDMSYKLTNEEQGQVDAFDELIQEEELAQKMLETTYFGLDDDYKVTDVRYFTKKPYYDNETENKYSIEISMNYLGGDEDTRGYADATYDAKTGQLISYYGGRDSEEGKKKISTDDAKRIATAAAKDLFGDYILQCGEAVEYSDEWSLELTYPRVYNGIEYTDDRIYISVGLEDGTLDSANLSWTENLTFPEAEGALLTSDAQTVFKGSSGIDYYYAIFSDYSKRGIDAAPDYDVRLLYSYSGSGAAFMDAFSGKLLDWRGDEYVKKESHSLYGDIAGHWAEGKITELWNAGIKLDGENFRPNDAITQYDFMVLLAQSAERLYYYDSMTQDDLYNMLKWNDVVDENERAPEASVSREAAASFIVRAMGYREVAEIESIYTSSFADESNTSKPYIGAVAIARGLGVIEGDGKAFAPTRDTTRAEAAVMMYNLLTR